MFAIVCIFLKMEFSRIFDFLLETLTWEHSIEKKRSRLVPILYFARRDAIWTFRQGISR